MKRILAPLAVITMSLVVGLQAQTVYFSNLSATDGTPTNSITATTWVAARLMPDTTATLNSVSLKLATPTNTTSNFLLELYPNTAGGVGDAPFGVPLTTGEPLATLTAGSNPTSAGTYTFTPTTSVTINAMTPFWIIAKAAPGSGNYTWQTITGTSDTTNSWVHVNGPTGAMIASTIDGGLNWDSAYTTTWDYKFEVTASAVPEPSTYAALAGLGALGFAGWRRRRKA